MERCCVCVVDDSEEACEVLCEGLRLHNYRAIPVPNGLQALEVCTSHAVDLVLLDVCLPDIDGYEVCKRLKADSRYSKTKIIILSAKGQDHDKQQGKQAGADGYLTKPFSPKQLLEVVNKHIG